MSGMNAAIKDITCRAEPIGIEVVGLRRDLPRDNRETILFPQSVYINAYMRDAGTMRIDVALVTYKDSLPVTEDDALLLDALRERGLRVEPFAWDDPGVDWAAARLTVIRSPWDYHLRREEFLAWAERVGRMSDLWNRPDTVRWNSHKTYLRDLQERGAPIIPTVWLDMGEEADLPDLMRKHGWGDVVVKPVVSLDAYGALRVGRINLKEGQTHLARLLVERDMMLQPYMSAVEGYGERSLVYIDGELSHAVRRSPTLSRGHGEEFAVAAKPAPDEIRLAESAIRAAGHQTLYARVDMARDDKRKPRLMELELVEPTLFFREAPDSPERMAGAIVRRLEGWGSGGRWLGFDNSPNLRPPTPDRRSPKQPMLDRQDTTRRTVPLYTILLPVIALIAAIVIGGQMGDGRLHMWVLDVGQGDGILVRTPGGHTALVDGGPGATPLLNGVGRNLPFWQRHVDLVVLTHPHDDHMAGLVELAGRYNIGQVAQTVFTTTAAGAPVGGGAMAEWLYALKERGVPVYHPRRGDRIGFQGEPDVTLQVLSPTSQEARFEWQSGDINNTSIVLRLDYGRHSFLLAGDAQLEAEADMALRIPDALSSQVLKVGHHGSDTSSTPRFLQLVRPQVAVISSGAGNKYGHPSPQTLEALSTIGAKVYRTDEDGTVEFIADKERLWVRSER